MVPPTRRNALQVLGAASLAGLAGCSSLLATEDYEERPADSLGTDWTPPAREWRYPRGDLRNTAGSGVESRRQPSVDWRADGQSRRDDRQRTHLAGVTRELVVLGTETPNGLRLSAYDTADGTRRWRRQIAHEDSLFPRFGGIVDGTVYFSDVETDVLAVDVADGTVRWRIDLYDRVAETVPDRYLTGGKGAADRLDPLPKATPDWVYVQTAYGVHGLAPSDGTEQWRIYLGEVTDGDATLKNPGGLAVTEDRVLTSYAWPEDLLVGVRYHDDEPAVNGVPVPVAYPSDPLVVDSRTTGVGTGVTWATDAGEALAAGADGSRSVAWQFEGLANSGSAAFSRLASDGTRVFVCEAHRTSGEFVVFAVRADEGGFEWLHRESFAESGFTVPESTDLRVADPVVAGETVLTGFGRRSEAGATPGRLIALSTTDGRVRWRADLPITPIDLAPTDTGLYVCGYNSGVTALGVE